MVPSPATTTRLPALLPVLDLLNGDVVWGVAGQRESYRSIQSALCGDSKPTSISQALRAVVDHDWLYVADLDAIQHDEPQWDCLHQLVDEGLRLIVDAGVSEPQRATRLLALGATCVVVALETLADRTGLADIVSAVGGEQTWFSLDLLRGQLQGRPEVILGDDPISIGSWAIERGVTGLILLDLAGVGTGQGVSTTGLCQQLRSANPQATLVTGGGVRHLADVHNLLENGANSILVASALHQQSIGIASARGLPH